MTTPDGPSRRDFLTGRAARRAVEAVGERIADHVTSDDREPPTGRTTVRLQTRAMACDFALLLNEPLAAEVPFWRLSDALDRVHALEQTMTVYRDDSELSALNRSAAEGSVTVTPILFDVLRTALRIAEQTGGAFDPTSGPLITLWKQCRSAGRVPTDDEVAVALQQCGHAEITLDPDCCGVAFPRPGLSLDLGGIGKGYALDLMAADIRDAGEQDFLLHGGHSSVIAGGGHTGLDGWPVGIRDPLRTTERLGTLLLQDEALSTSGAGTQFFRYRGRKYGHILDPRTGWPAETGLLSVSVVAREAALADALSTAFYVLGVQNALAICDTFEDVGCILIPATNRGRRPEPIVHRITPKRVFLSAADPNKRSPS